MRVAHAAKQVFRSTPVAVMLYIAAITMFLLRSAR